MSVHIRKGAGEEEVVKLDFGVSNQNLLLCVSEQSWCLSADLDALGTQL